MDGLSEKAILTINEVCAPTGEGGARLELEDIIQKKRHYSAREVAEVLHWTTGGRARESRGDLNPVWSGVLLPVTGPASSVHA